MLREELPGLATYRHETQNQQVPSVRAFFKNFLTTVKHTKFNGETFDLRLRVSNRLVDDARASGLDISVLLIDEANALSIQDFLFLKDIDNTLTNEGVKLVTIMMGQHPDFDGVLGRLHEEHRLDLVARFTIRRTKFRAYSSVQDLSAVLKGIDEAEFPPDSGVTWTQYFFPLAFLAGFRLENEASNLESALRKVTESGAENAYPARQTFLAIRSLLVDNAAFDVAGMQLRPQAWAEAVEYARVQEALLLTEASTPRNRKFRK
jgi:hypothetical protein